MCRIRGIYNIRMTRKKGDNKPEHVVRIRKYLSFSPRGSLAKKTVRYEIAEKLKRWSNIQNPNLTGFNILGSLSSWNIQYLPSEILSVSRIVTRFRKTVLPRLAAYLPLSTFLQKEAQPVLSLPDSSSVFISCCLIGRPKTLVSSHFV